ncbi:hypothetical protein J2X76_005609 [Neorhizobium sp. 2083]|uniref:hypothetical protein n=1 Tax=Neorhizobium sp. 2083 TaxID=2817762 RepID=UPI002854CCC3|nr:hypothetical protein [Neorhizobium sp. 2083]MDR6820412.1 hypothetical protein [Neorhizobium sp. 2083]
MVKSKLYELTPEQWRGICDLSPGKPTDPGRSGADNLERLSREANHTALELELSKKLNVRDRAFAMLHSGNVGEIRIAAL